MVKKSALLMGLLAAIGLVACGGGSNSTTPTNTVSGKVVDGYIANATVCVDLNKNQTCDPGEPSTTSDSNGAYTLSFTGDLSNLIIVADVFGNAIDKDDGITMSEAGRTPYSMSAPAINASVISPLTTLVTYELLSNGINTPITASTVAAAQAVVQSALATTTPLMANDYIASGNTELHSFAKVVAAAFTEVEVEALVVAAPVIAQTITDPMLAQQALYYAQKTGMYAALSTVVNFANNDALLYSDADAQINVVFAADILGATGSGLTTTMTLQPPPITDYLNPCPTGTDPLACFKTNIFYPQP